MKREERGEIRVETKRNRCPCRKKASRVRFNVSIFISRSLFRVEKALPSFRNGRGKKFSLWQNKIYARGRRMFVTAIIITYVCSSNWRN